MRCFHLETFLLIIGDQNLLSPVNRKDAKGTHKIHYKIQGMGHLVFSASALPCPSTISVESFQFFMDYLKGVLEGAAASQGHRDTRL